MSGGSRGYRQGPGAYVVLVCCAVPLDSHAFVDSSLAPSMLVCCALLFHRCSPDASSMLSGASS